jgi:hypothetical protein
MHSLNLASGEVSLELATVTTVVRQKSGDYRAAGAAHLVHQFIEHLVTTDQTAMKIVLFCF